MGRRLRRGSAQPCLIGPGFSRALLVAVLIGGLAAVAAQEVSIKILVNDDPDLGL